MTTYVVNPQTGRRIQKDGSTYRRWRRDHPEAPEPPAVDAYDPRHQTIRREPSVIDRTFSPGRRRPTTTLEPTPPGSDPRWGSHPVHAPRARRAEGSRWEEDPYDPSYPPPPPTTREREDFIPRGDGGGGRKHHRRSYSSPSPTLSPGRWTPSYRGDRLPDERDSRAEPRGEPSWNDTYPSREASRGMSDRQVPDDLVEDEEDTRTLHNLLREHGRTLLAAHQRSDIEFMRVFLDTLGQVDPRL